MKCAGIAKYKNEFTIIELSIKNRKMYYWKYTSVPVDMFKILYIAKLPQQYLSMICYLRCYVVLSVVLCRTISCTMWYCLVLCGTLVVLCGIFSSTMWYVL